MTLFRLSFLPYFHHQYTSSSLSNLIAPPAAHFLSVQATKLNEKVLFCRTVNCYPNLLRTTKDQTAENKEKREVATFLEGTKRVGSFGSLLLCIQRHLHNNDDKTNSK